MFDPVTHDSGCVLLLGYKSQIFLPYIQQVGITDNRKENSLPCVKTPLFTITKKTTPKQRSLATFRSIGTPCAGSLSYPGVDGTEREWAEGRRTEEKAQGKPCANVYQGRTNYHS